MVLRVLLYNEHAYVPLLHAVVGQERRVTLAPRLLFVLCRVLMIGGIFLIDRALLRNHLTEVLVGLNEFCFVVLLFLIDGPIKSLLVTLCGEVQLPEGLSDVRVGGFLLE